MNHNQPMYSPSYPSQYQQSHTFRQQPTIDQRVIQAVRNAIIGEVTAIDFYTRLVQMAPDEKHRNDINHALQDEKVHLQLFTQLYTYLTGQQLTYQINPKQFSTYEEGLQLAYEDELEAYEDYRNSYLLTNNPMIRDTFFRAFTDEIEHAIRFGFLLAELKK
jgi:rubrerythrin